MSAPTAAEIAQALIDGPSADLVRMVDSVIELRKRTVLPSIDDGPREAMERLLQVRASLDLIEERLTIVVRARAGLRDAHKVAVAAHDDAWALLAGRGATRGRGSSGWGEPAPRERYAEADLATLENKRQVRKFERWLDQANDAVDIIMRAYRSLDAVRQDLHVILRAMNVESSLER